MDRHTDKDRRREIAGKADPLPQTDLERREVTK